MLLQFSGEVFEWRGPAPHHFVRVPEDEAAEIAEVKAAVTYGWGVIPVEVGLGETTWSTSLFPKDGTYLVPLRDNVRRAEGVELGDVVDLRLTLDV